MSIALSNSPTATSKRTTSLAQFARRPNPKRMPPRFPIAKRRKHGFSHEPGSRGVWVAVRNAEDSVTLRDSTIGTNLAWS